MTGATLGTLPAELVFCILSRLSPYDILSLIQVSKHIQSLCLAQLEQVHGMRISTTRTQIRTNTSITNTLGTRHDLSETTKREDWSMSEFELYTRLTLSDFSHHEQGSYQCTKEAAEKVVQGAERCCRKILRRLCLQSGGTMSKENVQILARVIVDHVCRDKCLPETAVLILQCLTTLVDQHEQPQVAMSDAHRDGTSSRRSTVDGQVSVGVLSFQCLVPVILQMVRLQTKMQDSSKNNTMDLLSVPQGCPVHIRSIPHLTRVLCFLPLLGRHFNVLSASTFMETFLDRPKGDLLIDRAAVMVYGFMCALDLQTGKASLLSEGYGMYQRSMPTQGVVQAEEIVRIMERYKQLVQTQLQGRGKGLEG